MENSYSSFLSLEYESLSPSQKYEFFVSIVTEAVKNNTPSKTKIKKKNGKIKNPAPWWDAECKQIKTQRSDAFKKYNQTKELNDLIDYKRKCALAIRTFKCKKKECFRNFASSIDIHTDPKYVWDKCKIFKNIWVQTKPSHMTSNHQTKDMIEASVNKICPP